VHRHETHSVGIFASARSFAASSFSACRGELVDDSSEEMAAADFESAGEIVMRALRQIWLPPGA